LQQVETAIRQKPVASGTVGFLTAFAVPALAAILAVISAVLLLICIGIVGFAIVFAMLALLGIAGLLGWIAVGDLLGQWLARRVGWHKMSPSVVAAFGTGLLTFTLGFLSAIPFTFGVGLVSVIISFIGLGAVALTKFGTQSYPLVRIVGEDDVDDIKIQSVLDTLPDDE
jgi:PPE-repeat protein